MAYFTGHVDIGQEIHFDADDAVAPAGFTAAAFDVETKPAGFIATDLGFRRLAEQLADEIKDPRIGSRVGSGSPSDRRLVDIDDFIDVFCAAQFFKFSRPVGRTIHGFCHPFIKDFIDQCRFS